MKTPIPLLTSVGVLILLFFSADTQAQAPNSWEQKNDLGYTSANGPTARNSAASFSIGTKGYIATGDDGERKKDLWEYDPGTDSWSQKADFGGTARKDAVAFSIGNKGYVGTGNDNSGYKKDFWEYDPAANTWVQKADFGGSARHNAVGFSIGSKGYLGTGFDGILPLPYKRDFWEYDPAANTWTQKANLGSSVLSSRENAVGFSIGSKGYIGTGNDLALKRDFWEYNPGTNTWASKAQVGSSNRTEAVGFNIGTKGYIGTGRDGLVSFRKDILEYDPGANTWTAKVNFGGSARNNATAFSIGSKGYIGTGFDLALKVDIWDFDPLANTSSKRANFGGPPKTKAVSFTIGNKGYLGTGQDGTLSIKKDFWEYDPANGYWTQKADFGGSARQGAVGFSVGSKGYIGTGNDGVFSLKKDIWEYDPSGNTWTQKNDFGGTARQNAVAFSIGGKAYLGTGQDGLLSIRKDFWEYDPGSDSWTPKADFGGSARQNAVGFPIGSKGYIGTGDEGILALKNDFWEYNPNTDSWTQKADVGGAARDGAVGFSINTKGYLGTGRTALSTFTNDFWEYEPTTDSWLQRDSFGGTARQNAIGFSLSGRGYLGTGTDGTYQSDFWQYRPCADLTTSITGAKPVCQNDPPVELTFFAAGGTAPYSFTYQINGGANQNGNGDTLAVSQPTATVGPYVYTIVNVEDARGCSSAQTTNATVYINTKPVVSLSINGETVPENGSLTVCDSDANASNNLLTVNTITPCLGGPLYWRTQSPSGIWTDWSTTSPAPQPSSNTPYNYQVSCSQTGCSSTASGLFTLTINYRAATPQNASLTADGISITAGQAGTVCDLPGNALNFSATCTEGEILLYSVDGGDYSTVLPTQIVDNNFHNYRLRCRKADGTPSCYESESDAMSIRIMATPPTPFVSISPTSGCSTPTALSNTTTCGALTTLWYNAATNQLLATLPTTTPTATTSYYVRCQNAEGCLSPVSNTVTFTYYPINETPVVTATADIVCAGTTVTLSASCPPGSTVFWNTGVTETSFQVAFNNVTRQSYWARCVFPGGCQSAESIHKNILWKGFELTFINIGSSQSGIKPGSGVPKTAWTSQFITADAGPILENSTQANPTIYFSENVNKTAPRFWTIHADVCALGTDGSLTFDLLATPETGVVRSYNTHENNAPYLMYANRDGFTELYAQNHPAYGFFADNGSGGNVYDEGLPKGLYKLGIRYWSQKGQGSIYPSTRQPQGVVLAYQEYWFRIQSKDGVGTGAARTALNNEQLSDRRTAINNGQWTQVMPNPVSKTLHLKVSEAKGQKVSISLLDATGRSLLQSAFVPETNQHQEEFEVSDLANGMYFIRVNTADKQTTLKVIKIE